MLHSKTPMERQLSFLRMIIYRHLSLLFNNLNRVQTMNNNDNIKQPSIASNLFEERQNYDIPPSSERFPVESLEESNRKSAQLKEKTTQTKHQTSKTNNKHFNQSSQPQISHSSKHNFQKHTVITVKKLAKRLPDLLGASAPEKVALQMWNIFLSSGIKSKKILVILFGKAALHEQKYKDLLKSFFFGEICNYEQGLVRMAQTILRTKILEYLREEVMRASIWSNRHIQHKEEFIAYFCEFINTLRQGPLIKFRINSKTSKHIEERIRTAESLQEGRRKPIKQTAPTLK